MTYEEKFQKMLIDHNLGKEYIVIGKKSGIIILKHIPCGNILATKANRFFDLNEHCFFCELEKESNGRFKVIEFTGDSRSNYLIEDTTTGIRFKNTRNRWRTTKFLTRDNNRKAYTLESFKEALEKIYGDKYSIISTQYAKSKYDKLIFKCNNCGNIFEKLPSHMLEGRECSNCWSNKIKKSNEFFKEEVEKLFKGEIKILSEYNRYDSKMEFYCEKCKNTFTKVAKDLLDSGYRGSCGCKYCFDKSLGQSKIRDILTNKQIPFEPEFSFQDLFDKDSNRPLRFDFAIFDNKKSGLLALIEFDGPQHKEEYIGKTSFISNKEEFDDLKRRDLLKNEYCKNHFYRLIRIPYDDLYNVEKILKNEKII